MFLPHHCTQIDLFATLSLNLQQTETEIMILRTWRRRERSKTDTLIASTHGSGRSSRITDRVFATNVFMGLSMAVGSD